jgi:hypothetical protein
MRSRPFLSVRELCIVADRAMIGAETSRALESADPSLRYVLNARMSRQKEWDGRPPLWGQPLILNEEERGRWV